MDPIRPTIPFKESSWGEDSSNRNQYFGFLTEEESENEEVEISQDDKVISGEGPLPEIVPSPHALLKKRGKRTLPAILETMAFNAENLSPFKGSPNVKIEY